MNVKYEYRLLKSAKIARGEKQKQVNDLKVEIKTCRKVKYERIKIRFPRFHLCSSLIKAFTGPEKCQ